MEEILKNKRIVAYIIILVLILPMEGLAYSNGFDINTDPQYVNDNIEVYLSSATKNIDKLKSKGNNKEFHTILGNSTLKKKREFTKDEKKVIEEELVAVLKNIELSNQYLKKISFFASPYELVGANGFTLSRYKDNQLDQIIVIAVGRKNNEIGSQRHREEIRSTLLHEIGHGYRNILNKSKRIDLDSQYKAYYSELVFDVSNNNIEKWKNSTSENFAEDFRIYFSSKLGGLSFKPHPKKTNKRFNKSVGELFYI